MSVFGEVWNEEWLTLLQSHTLQSSVEEQRSPEVFSMSVDRIDLFVVESIIGLRFKDTSKSLPLKHDCDVEYTFVIRSWTARDRSCCAWRINATLIRRLSDKVSA
jgi:hypothetical protein